jgi:hypothetical protein
MSHVNDVRTPRGVRLTETSLAITRSSLSQEEFEDLLGTLVRVEHSAPWWIGDAIAYSTRRWGRTYALATKATGKSPNTLRNYAWVSRKVPPENRDPSLPWRSHYLVASMGPDDQRLWLAHARKWGWTSAELHEQVQASRSAEADPEEDAFRKPSTHADFRCPNCGWAWSGQPYVRRGTA